MTTKNHVRELLMARLITRYTTMLIACLAFAGCSATSSFEWLSLASWSQSEFDEARANDIHIYYYTSEEIDDGAVDIVVREDQTGRAEYLTAHVVERREVVRSTWMGDQKCYAYHLVLSPEAEVLFTGLQSAWTQSVEFRAPRAESGLAWLIGAESEIRVSPQPVDLDAWLDM